MKTLEVFLLHWLCVQGSSMVYRGVTRLKMSQQVGRAQQTFSRAYAQL